MKTTIVATLLFVGHMAWGQSLEATVRKVADLPMSVKESSGIVTSGVDKVWTHSDSGYDNELYLVDTTGSLLRTLVVGNAINMDWEDLARDDMQRIWINDAGNNGNGRSDLTLYRIDNPDTHNQDTVQADVLTFNFSDQTAFPPGQGNMNFDIEAMVWFNDSIFLFTKNRSMPFNGYTKMYSLPAQSGNYVAQLRDSLFVDSDIQRGRITAADIDTSTGTIALLTRSMVLCFVNYPGSHFFQGTELRYSFTSRVDQVEALAFINSSELYMTDEGSPANSVPGGLYRVTLSSLLSRTEYQAPSMLRVFEIDGTLHVLHYGDGMLKIVSTEGKLCHQGLFSKEGNIDVSTFRKGMYIILLQRNDGKILVRKHIH